MMLEEYNINQWVDAAEKAPDAEFRQAVHTILSAIANEPKLKASMIIKGGILMAIRYHSHRYTKDIDFSTSEKLGEITKEDVEERLNASLSMTVESLDYGLDCRVQSIKVDPSDDATYPNLRIKIGYAYKGTPKHKRLEASQSPTAIKIDYNLNELTPNIETLVLSDEEEVLAYSLTDLVAEKLRSLLQQAKRDRTRRQDIFDLHLILESFDDFDEVEKKQILDSLIAKSNSRDLEVDPSSLANEEIRERAFREYHTLEDEVEGELPDFDESYEQILDFYYSLPWPNS